VGQISETDAAEAEFPQVSIGPTANEAAAHRPGRKFWFFF